MVDETEAARLKEFEGDVRTRQTISALTGEARPSAKTVYIVRTAFSSGQEVVERKKVDGQTEEIHYLYTEEMRAKISSTRSKFRSRIMKECISFYGLMVTKGDKLDRITAIVDELGRELFEVHESLSAKVSYVPVSVDAQTQGELYNGMMNAIRTQLWKIMLERLEDLVVKDKVPERSRLAILKLVDSLHSFNVLDDRQITEKLNNWKVQLEHGVFKPIAEGLKKEYDAMVRNEGVAVEI